MHFDFMCKPVGNSSTVHTDTFSNNTNMLVHHGDIVIVRVDCTKHRAQLAGGKHEEQTSAGPKVQRQQLDSWGP